MKEYEIWIEGYAVTGNSSGAQLKKEHNVKIDISIL